MRNKFQVNKLFSQSIQMIQLITMMVMIIMKIDHQKVHLPEWYTTRCQNLKPRDIFLDMSVYKLIQMWMKKNDKSAYRNWILKHQLFHYCGNQENEQINKLTDKLNKYKQKWLDRIHKTIKNHSFIFKSTRKKIWNEWVKKIVSFKQKKWIHHHFILKIVCVLPIFSLFGLVMHTYT